MDSLRELKIDFFINNESQLKYQAICDSVDDVATKIYNLMTLNPGFMENTVTYEDDHIDSHKDITIKELSRVIDSGKIIRLVMFYFNFKPAKTSVSGGIVSPDASDYLVLLHLNLLVKYISKIYPPGISIRIGDETSYYHKLSGLSRNDGDESHAILVNLNNIAQVEVGNHLKVILYDFFSTVDRYPNEFYNIYDSEKSNLLSNESVMNDLKRTSRYYLDYVIDISGFKQEEEAELLAINHVVNSVCSRNSLLKMNEKPDGLLKYFDEILYIQTRFTDSTRISKQDIKPEIYCSIFPGAKTFSFNMLTLRTMNGLWRQITMDDIEEYGYKPYYVQDLPYPFFYTE